MCSRSFSPWFMAHIPDLLARHPSAPATLCRFLPHFGADQVNPLPLCIGTSSSNVPLDGRQRIILAAQITLAATSLAGRASIFLTNSYYFSM